jgi:hypothetical protein
MVPVSDLNPVPEPDLDPDSTQNVFKKSKMIGQRSGNNNAASDIEKVRFCTKFLVVGKLC